MKNIYTPSKKQRQRNALKIFYEWFVMVTVLKEALMMIKSILFQLHKKNGYGLNENQLKLRCVEEVSQR